MELSSLGFTLGTLGLNGVIPSSLCVSVTYSELWVLVLVSCLPQFLVSVSDSWISVALWYGTLNVSLGSWSWYRFFVACVSLQFQTSGLCFGLILSALGVEVSVSNSLLALWYRTSIVLVLVSIFLCLSVTPVSCVSLFLNFGSSLWSHTFSCRCCVLVSDFLVSL